MPLAMFESRQKFNDLLGQLPNANAAWQAAAKDRQKILTKPPGALGRLEEIAIFLSGWGKAPGAKADVIKVAIFAGNHGVVSKGISPYPAEVTAQMVANFANGGAAINALTNTFGLTLSVEALELDHPTGDISEVSALSEAEMLHALNAGAASVPDDIDVLCVGEMGIGNTTIASALAAATCGGSGSDWAGPGTGLDDDGVRVKAQIIDAAVARHKSVVDDAAFGRLSSLGGRETAAIAGAIIAARMKRVPVLLDGFVATASLAPLYAQQPAITAHCLAGHVSAEPAHRRLLAWLSLDPLFDLGMRLGEGSGAALASQVLRAAAATQTDMATFEEASVSNAKDEADNAGP